MKQRLWWLAAGVIGAASLWAQPVILQVQPVGNATPGEEAHVTMFALNRGAEPVNAPLPSRMAARLAAGERRWTVQLQRVSGGEGAIAAGAFAEAEYAYLVPADASGSVVFTLSAPGAGGVLVDLQGKARPDRLVRSDTEETAEAATQAEKTEVAKVAKPTTSGVPTPAISKIQRAFSDHFSAHQPVYFIFGPNDPAAKFQFSFKYRMVSDSVAESTTVQPLQGLYFAYTQRSLWNITESSSPFYDSSYMPEIFYERLEPAANQKGDWVHWLGYQGGLMHESNGRDGLSSRSLNIAFVRPMLMLGHFDGWNLILAPRVFAYVGGLSDNPTMANYRGHVEWNAYLGKNGGMALAITGRTGSGFHKGSLQLDLTYPLKSRLGNIATFFLVQYFNGYGEGLLNFDERSDTWRAGFSLVR
ncbi:phospholipase A [Horticoccus luteus]|uniref:Phosphatidylcholine 1-acylhydrolase n=1 Tax=Horticoccus luteus TaxID=2862869 RepID=A0A8F9TTJ0_9BACT|nr:phospholipase A [Horticoccus luteus]QYM77855.1 phospholipase A [Horticoccus luteus]